MKSKRNVTPPRWATRLLAWYCKPALLEDLEGDLNEYFERNVKTKGATRARLIYILDVLKFFRPYTVRQPEFLNLLIHWIMIGSYIRTSGRSLVRNKLFSAINIVGLAISMAVGLLMIALLSDMHRYDKFHEHHDRIYRVTTRAKFVDSEDRIWASTSLRAGQSIQESIPGIDKVAILHRNFTGDMQSGGRTVPLSGHWANESFFDVFTFPMISGDPSTALRDPWSIVLTETSAKKLFGDTDALGKSVIRPVEVGNQDYVVTGIIKDVPAFSHMKFDMLASMSTRALVEKENTREMSWANMWSGYVYLLLPEETDLQNLQHNLNILSAKEDQTVENTSVKLSLELQPLSQIALGENLNNSIGPVMVKSNVWMIGILTVIVILSACFNYTNLSIARSLRRSREVGIRKVVGALRIHVLGQFVVEAVIIALCALVFSFGLFVLMKPWFLSLNDQYARMLVLEVSPRVVLYFVLFAMLVGMAAGLVPAIFFARVNAVRVLKNLVTVPVFRKVTMRKALIVVQFTISLMFIAATIIGYKHYRHLLAFDLGFKTEDVLNIRLYDNNADLLKKELSQIAEIRALSTSSMITSVGYYRGISMKYLDPLDSTFVNYTSVDEHYLPLHGHTLLAGRNFSARADSAAESEVIVSEQVLRRFNIADQDPRKAVGEIVTVDRKNVQIIGVVRDFYYGRSDGEIKEFIFRHSSDKAEYVNAKVISNDWPATLEKIERAWKDIDDVHPLEAAFYDDQIENAYRGFSSRVKVIGALSFLAICIASFGLLGMVVFTTETRLKEISIRKVMGAGEGNLVILLSKGFLLLLIIATAIALPSAHFFFVEYALEEYAERAPLAWKELMIGVAAVIAIAFIMIGTHTLKVARTNPAEVLKAE